MRKDLIRRAYRDRAEMIRADAYWLGVRYADQPVPFWPMDHPTTLEGNPTEVIDQAIRPE